jgi:hypothetical protein
MGIVLNNWFIRCVPILLLIFTLTEVGFAAPVATPILCSQITDQLCRELWDADHRGHLKVVDGELDLGRSNKSNLLTISALTDLRALLAAESRLPRDLQKRAKPLLVKLRELIQQEAETIRWLRLNGRWNDDWQRMLNDVAEERALKKDPTLGKVRLSERTQAELMPINREYYKLFDQITLAKYVEHPNWQRVKHSFEEIRGHLLSEIAEFPMADSTKEFLVRRVKEVELTLPFLDLDVFDSRKDCAESLINAFYSPGYNKITVCTGMFNSLKSEAAIYSILAHELSHSIDPGVYNSAWLRANGQRLKLVADLIGVQKQALPCDDWGRRIKKMEEIAISKVLQPRPYDQLALCLDNNKALTKEFDPAEIARQVNEDLVDDLNYYANRNSFTHMLIPTYTEFEKVRRNPYFFNPEVLVSELNGKGYTPAHSKMRGYVFGPELFFQVIQCEYEKTKTPLPKEKFFTSQGDGTRDQVLKNAIEETKRILSMIYEEGYYNCGQYCQPFVKKGMARNVDEKFADWMSFRIFRRYLEKQKTLEERRRSSALAVAYLCDTPSVRQEAGSLLEVEKSFSIEPHAENRSRRLGFYNRDIAELLSCEPETKEIWGSCKIESN